MKLFIVAAILGVCIADRLDNKYLPPRGNSGAGFGPGFGAGGASFGGPAYNQPSGFGGTQNSGNAYNAGPAQGFGGRGSAPGPDANAQILKLNSEVTADGFSYEYETSNGIRADAQGVATNGVQSQGSFAYKGDDGQEYSITYTADENGYQPQGAHLPTPPPIPEAILKSLEQNARDEAAGIVDDGTYRGEGAGAGGYSGNGGYSSGGPGAGFGAGAGNNFGAAGAGRPFGGAGNFGGASRQYLTPNTGAPRPGGSGNFNSQSGYKY